VLLLTGATGLVGSPLLRRLTARGEPVRCLVRDPRRLGPERVRVQITIGDLTDPRAYRQALRGARTVVHLAASHRDLGYEWYSEHLSMFLAPDRSVRWSKSTRIAPDTPQLVGTRGKRSSLVVVASAQAFGGFRQDDVECVATSVLKNSRCDRNESCTRVFLLNIHSEISSGSFGTFRSARCFTLARFLRRMR